MPVEGVVVDAGGEEEAPEPVHVPKGLRLTSPYQVREDRSWDGGMSDLESPVNLVERDGAGVEQLPHHLGPLSRKIHAF